jgi:hypothetical protein
MCCDQHSFVSGENEFQDVYADICKPSTGRNFNPMKQAPKSASLEGIVFGERARLTGGNGGQATLFYWRWPDYALPLAQDGHPLWI